MDNGSDEELLARDIIDVHGAQAAIIARENARGAALAGQPAQAKSWIRVLGNIQRYQQPRHIGESADRRSAGRRNGEG